MSHSGKECGWRWIPGESPTQVFGGSPKNSHGEDLGNPLFYSHHGNVDRMWNVWKTEKRKRGHRQRASLQPWLEVDPAASLVPGATAMAAKYPVVKSSSQNGEPVKVGAGPLAITVAQPKGSARDEILVLEEMEIGMPTFNVFINLPEANESTTVACAEYVGSFNNIPHFMPRMTESSTRTPASPSRRTSRSWA
ncbi:polyphenol oxidase latent form, chloroplastic [Selaginella moellendorffii]|uniref:polyphenol oxidase latent form, chloroplastic n=1 Tax=Selaginella moellendorffii TaxID=88036 RepID=UPI000D1C699C|nr:polyphenol oxidase latent form, chloroplastic [Selaginella moellendorffii]|eukprot:XP_024541271.1 polyphenol oxidase latent form, chloroplastic [Selaginella moellendorffii]